MNPSGNTRRARQYLLQDKKYRRYSAPENLSPPYFPASESEDDAKSRISAVDLSILFESNSDSSCELDTSNISRITTPIPASECQVCEAYQNQRKDLFYCAYWTKFCTRLVWKTIFIAQIISICICSMTIIIKSRKCDGFSKTGENAPVYFLLGITWTVKLAQRGNGRGVLQVVRLSGIRYFFLALLHVFASNLSYYVTDHDSSLNNNIIDCVAATLSLIVCYVCLEIQFSACHLTGFGLAFLGAIGLCIMDTQQREVVDSMIWGDILKICCGLFLALNSIAQELIVKSLDIVEYLGMVGLVGSFICGCYLLLFETDALVPKSPTHWCLLILYTILQYAFYCLAPKLLRDIGTTGLHISITSSGFYFYFFQLFTDSSKPSQVQPWVFLYFFLTITGSYIYALKRTIISKHYFYPVKITLPN